MTRRSKYNSARSAVKNLFTQPPIILKKIIWCEAPRKDFSHGFNIKFRRRRRRITYQTASPAI
jgi:hypothetical protein